MKASAIRDKSFALAVRIVKLNQFLTGKKGEYVISKQLLRCGTSPGANVREAQNAESSFDFIHKLGIAQKETAETLYWIELLFVTGYLTKKQFESVHQDADELLRMIRSAILTKRKNLTKNVV